jgi:hypothetical protein
LFRVMRNFYGRGVRVIKSRANDGIGLRWRSRRGRSRLLLTASYVGQSGLECLPRFFFFYDGRAGHATRANRGMSYKRVWWQVLSFPALLHQSWKHPRSWRTEDVSDDGQLGTS